MPINICIAGATGNVGRRLVAAVLEAEDLKLTSAIGKKSAGRDLGECIGDDRVHLIIKSSVAEALEADIDVLIDYTKPSEVKNTVCQAVENGIHVVVGTSGMTDSDYDDINLLAREHGVGVFAAGNFSITATLLQEFAQKAARFLPTWEIIDFAPDTKPDAPSGTTRELTYHLGKIKKSEWSIPPESVHGHSDSRGARINHSLVHSVRVPGFYSSVEVIFGSPGERLSLRHDSISYQPYVEGTLLAVRQVSEFVGLKRGLASLMNL